MDHQIQGIAWLRERSRALLADEPGLGKSLQALRSAEDPILVVAPAMVLDSGTWDDEIEKWAPGAEVDQVSYSSIAERGPRGRIERDARGNPKVKPKDRYLRKYKRVILDESHYIKGRKTSWTVALQRLVDPARGASAPDSVVQMTGTPIPNWAWEAFTTLQVLWPEHTGRGRRFGSYWRWVDQWFHNGPTYNRAGELLSPRDVGDFRDAEHIAGCWQCQERGLQPRTWDEFYVENWGDRMLRRYREDCLDLPPFTEQVWKVRMTRSQARAYRQLKRDFVTWLEDGTEIVAWNQASQLVKLVMCSTGLEVLEYYGASDPRRPRGAWNGSAKLDTLAWMLENRPRPTLVTAHFRGSVECCAAVAEGIGASVRVIHGGTSRNDRRRFVREFQSGGLQVLCASIEVIAEGMTLTAADQIIQVEKSWRPSKNRQAVDRLHRIGQTRPVTAIDLVTEGTVDEGIRRHLDSKNDQQMRALGRRDLISVV